MSDKFGTRNNALGLEFTKEISKAINDNSEFNCTYYEGHHWTSVYVEEMFEYEIDMVTEKSILSKRPWLRIACGSQEVFSTFDFANPNLTPENLARIIVEDFKIRRTTTRTHGRSL